MTIIGNETKRCQTITLDGPALGYSVLQSIRLALVADAQILWWHPISCDVGYEVSVVYKDGSLYFIGAEAGESILPSMFYRTLEVRISQGSETALVDTIAYYISCARKTNALRSIVPQACTAHPVPVEVTGQTDNVCPICSNDTHISEIHPFSPLN